MDVKIFINYYKNIILNHLQAYFNSFLTIVDILTEPENPLVVYKILIYDEDTNERINVTKDYYNGLNHNIPYDNYRIEYRFKWKKTKYRYIEQKNDDKPFIQLQDLYKKPFGVKIINCILFDEIANDHDETDVLEKIKKYAGPNHNFFNKKLKPSWLFPSEDFMDGQKLIICNSLGKLSIINMNDNCEDFIN